MPVMKYDPERIPDADGTVLIHLPLLVELIEKAYENNPVRIEVMWGEPDKNKVYAPVFKRTGRV
jgi:hypothetical protein